MQSAEKITTRFVLKLALLFALLLSGWMLKAAKPARPANARSSVTLQLPAATKPDAQQEQPFYFRLVKQAEVSSTF